VLGRSAAFPITPTNELSLNLENAQLGSLFWYLPPAHRADELRQLYFVHAAWMFVHFSIVGPETQRL
jgi:hypothetical protein